MAEQAQKRRSKIGTVLKLIALAFLLVLIWDAYIANDTPARQAVIEAIQ